MENIMKKYYEKILESIIPKLVPVYNVLPLLICRSNKSLLKFIYRKQKKTQAKEQVHERSIKL